MKYKKIITITILIISFLYGLTWYSYQRGYDRAQNIFNKNSLDQSIFPVELYCKDGQFLQVKSNNYWCVGTNDKKQEERMRKQGLPICEILKNETSTISK